MSYMFHGCTSLSSLPDISKWDTKNVTNMSYMFYWCSSLPSLLTLSSLLLLIDLEEFIWLLFSFFLLDFTSFDLLILFIFF